MAQVIPFRRRQPTTPTTPPSAAPRASLGNKMQLLASVHPQSLKRVELYVDQVLAAHGGRRPIGHVPGRVREEH